MDLFEAPITVHCYLLNDSTEIVRMQQHCPGITTLPTCPISTLRTPALKPVRILRTPLGLQLFENSSEVVIRQSSREVTTQVRSLFPSLTDPHTHHRNIVLQTNLREITLRSPPEHLRLLLANRPGLSR